MALYVLTCIDKPDSLALRMATREAHLAYVRGFLDRLPAAGPFLDANDNMAGSMLIFEAESLAEAEAFSANDPYRQAGLFERVEIRPFRLTLGKFG